VCFCGCIVFILRQQIAAERQVKELQANIEDLEAVGGKKLKQQITKLESKVREMEMDFEGETKKNSELTKANRRTERKLKELTFQVQEEQENNRRLNEQVNQHQTRDKQLRRRAEEAVSHSDQFPNDSCIWAGVCVP
jgi:ribosomal protein S6